MADIKKTKAKKAEVAKEGWLHVTVSTRKEGAITPRGTTPRGSRVPGRRYCRLREGALTISGSETTLTPLATIHAAGAALKEFSALDFTLSSNEAGVMRDYVLSCESRDAADTRGWVVALAEAAVDSPIHFGWLALQKEPRKLLWVLLSRGMLMWFSKEQDPCADPKTLLRTSSGYMRLVDYTAKALHDTSLLVTDVSADRHGQPSQRCVVFTARTAEERDAWLTWCEADRGRYLRRVAKGTEYSGFVRIQNKGMLLLLSRGVLAWYRKVDEPEPRASVHVEECDFKRELGVRGGAVFSVQNNKRVDAPSYEITAPSDPAATLWLERLEAAKGRAQKKRMVSADVLRAEYVNGRAKVAKDGWLLVAGRRRFVQLRDSALVWFADEAASASIAPTSLKGSVLLLDAAVTRSLLSFSVRASSHKTHVFEAGSEAECSAWVAALDAASEQTRGQAYAQRVGAQVVPSQLTSKQAWVLIKGKRRLLDLDVGRLLILDENLQIKHVISLTSCTAVRVPPTAFLLSTLDASYVCGVKSTDEVETWVTAIQMHIIRASAAALEMLDKSGWLLLDGKSKWCAIRGGAFHWFTNAHPPDFVPSPRHCVPLAGAHVQVLAQGSKAKNKAGAQKASFELHPPTVPVAAANAPWWVGRKFVIKAANESEAQAWAQAITKPASTSQSNSSSVLPTPVIGAPLAFVLASDRAAGRVGPEAQVPSLLRRVLDYLSTPSALATVGLFHAPGSFAKVREWSDKAAKGQEANLRDNATVHDVALLLRQLLRALPDPLVVRAWRAHVIASRSDAGALRGALLELPKEHMAALKAVLVYLVALGRAQERMRERTADLSVVFSPLIFGVAGDGDDNDVLLLQTVLTTTVLLRHGAALLDAKAPLPQEAEAPHGESGLDALLAAFQASKHAPVTPALNVSPSFARRKEAQEGEALSRLDSLEKELAADKERRLTLSDTEGPTLSLSSSATLLTPASSAVTLEAIPPSNSVESGSSAPAMRPSAHRRADQIMAPDGVESAAVSRVSPRKGSYQVAPPAPPSGVSSPAEGSTEGPLMISGSGRDNKATMNASTPTLPSMPASQDSHEEQLNAPLEKPAEKKLYQSIRVRVKSIGSKMKELMHKEAKEAKDAKEGSKPVPTSARADTRVEKEKNVKISNDVTVAPRSRHNSITASAPPNLTSPLELSLTSVGFSAQGALVSPREERRKNIAAVVAATDGSNQAEDEAQEKFLAALKGQQSAEEEEQKRLEVELRALLKEQRERKQKGDTALEDRELVRLAEEKKRLDEETAKKEEEIVKKKAGELKKLTDEEKKLQDELLERKKKRDAKRASERADSRRSLQALSSSSMSSRSSFTGTGGSSHETSSPDLSPADANANALLTQCFVRSTSEHAVSGVPSLGASGVGPASDAASSPRSGRPMRAALPPDLLQQIDLLLGPSLATRSPSGSTISRVSIFNNNISNNPTSPNLPPVSSPLLPVKSVELAGSTPGPQVWASPPSSPQSSRRNVAPDASDAASMATSAPTSPSLQRQTSRVPGLDLSVNLTASPSSDSDNNAPPPSVLAQLRAASTDAPKAGISASPVPSPKQRPDGQAYVSYDAMPPPRKALPETPTQAQAHAVGKQLVVKQMVPQSMSTPSLSINKSGTIYVPVLPLMPVPAKAPASIVTSQEAKAPTSTPPPPSYPPPALPGSPHNSTSLTSPQSAVPLRLTPLTAPLTNVPSDPPLPSRISLPAYPPTVVTQSAAVASVPTTPTKPVAASEVASGKMVVPAEMRRSTTPVHSLSISAMVVPSELRRASVSEHHETTLTLSVKHKQHPRRKKSIAQVMPEEMAALQGLSLALEREAAGLQRDLAQQRAKLVSNNNANSNASINSAAPAPNGANGGHPLMASTSTPAPASEAVDVPVSMGMPMSSRVSTVGTPTTAPASAPRDVTPLSVPAVAAPIAKSSLTSLPLPSGSPPASAPAPTTPQSDSTVATPSAPTSARTESRASSSGSAISLAPPASPKSASSPPRGKEERRVTVEIVTEKGTTTERSVVLIPGLTFEALLDGIARARANVYEMQDPSDGALLVGSVAAHFQGRPDTPWRVKLVPRTLDL